MEQSKHDSELLEWLKTQPEVLGKLEQMRLLERDDPDLERAEFELLELVKSMGAASMQRILQNKSDRASEESRKQSGGRIHGKKN